MQNKWFWQFCIKDYTLLKRWGMQLEAISESVSDLLYHDRNWNTWIVNVQKKSAQLES